MYGVDIFPCTHLSEDRLDQQKMRMVYVRLNLLFFVFYINFHLQTGNKFFDCVLFGPCFFDG